MKVAKISLMLLLVAILTVGCAVHQYDMGKGPSKGEVETARQWYILWGLIPLNNVDAQTMIGSSTDYSVRTAQEPLDVIMNIVTTYVTVTSRTVTVEK